MRIFCGLVMALVGFAATSQAVADDLVAAVLPSSRSAVLNSTVTAFATVINASTVNGTGCSIASGNASVKLSYQPTDPATNALTGTPNALISIAAGATQTFVISLTPTFTLIGADVPLVFKCQNLNAAASIVGLDTLLLTANTTASADVIALAATISGDGVARIPTETGSQAFAVATANVGAAATITVSADTGTAGLPVSIQVCETTSAGACMATPSASVTTSVAQNATPTFGVFVTSTGPIPFNPAAARVYVRFSDASGIVRGATSVAVSNPVQLSTNASPAGIYVGTLKGAAGKLLGFTDTATAVITDAGDVELISGSAAAAATLNLQQNLGFDVTGNYIDVGSFLTSGFSFGSAIISGTLAPQGSLLASFALKDVPGSTVSPGVDSAVFAGTYNSNLYERSVTLQGLAGTWSLRQGPTGTNSAFTSILLGPTTPTPLPKTQVLGTLQFAADGSFTGGDNSGCAYAGNVTIPTAGRNAIKLKFTTTRCPFFNTFSISNETMSGIGFLSDTEATDDTFLLGTTGGIDSFTAYLTRF